MDMKFKIIILVFVVIALLYAVHFMLTQLNAKTTKTETFIIDDDVEHYEDPVKTDAPVKPKPETRSDKTQEKYNTRVLILDDIEKMDITDKEIKGKLMEYLFTPESVSKIDSMSNTERSIFIQSKYDLLKTGAKLDVPSETTEKKKDKSEFASAPTIQPAPVIQTPSVTPPPAKKISSSVYDGLSDSNRDLYTKTEEALGYIQKVQSNIQQMQENIKSNAIYVDKLPEGHRDPDIPAIPSTPTHPVVEGFQNGPIAGFENVKNYASLF